VSRMLGMIRMPRLPLPSSTYYSLWRLMKRAILKTLTIPPESMTPTMPYMYPIVKIQKLDLL
jgi:hypothetical protein